MKLASLLKKKQKHNTDFNFLNRKYRNDDDDYGYVEYSGYKSQNHFAINNWLMLLQKVKTNKKHRITLIVVALVLLITVISLILLFSPYLLKLLNILSDTGIKSQVVTATSFFDKLLNEFK